MEGWIQSISTLLAHLCHDWVQASVDRSGISGLVASVAAAQLCSSTNAARNKEQWEWV